MTEAAEGRRLHPTSIVSRFIHEAPKTLLGVVPLLGVTWQTGLALLVLVGIGVVSIVFPLLGWLRFRYHVGPNEIVIESGVLSRNRRSIPFERVQDVDIERGPIARLFGTAVVRIETGSGGKDEGKLDSVSLDEAERLRATIRAARSGAVAVEEPEARPLFAMTLARVMLSGLFAFSLLFLAVIFSALQYLEPVIGEDAFDPRTWLRWLGIADLGPGRWIATLGVAIAALLLGMATGVVRTVMRDYGFTLVASEDGLRRRQGLFTLSDVLIPRRRVQALVFRRGPLMQLFGWHRLEFQTLGAGSVRSGHQVAAPFARAEELVPVVAEVRTPELPAEGDYAHVSRRMIVRSAGGYLVVLLGAALVGGFNWTPLFGLALLAPLTVVAGMLRWRRHRYLVAEDALHVAAGLLTARRWVVPLERLQSLSISRSFLQRRLGTASLHVDTAGASSVFVPTVVDLGAAEAEALARTLLAGHRSARRAQA